jgi:dienelactone hydrolase
LLEDGEPVSLEVVLFKPEAQGRFPTVVFNHGSTGNGSDPSLFGLTFTSKAVARHFVERGWMVAFPQRRGRGRSDGLYDEGFRPDRGGYSCAQDVALAGAERALDDLDAVTDWLRGRADVDTTRMLVAGTSRGGILSIAHAARRPDVFRGAVNFVGGWLGEGCGDYRSVNRMLFEAGAAFAGATLWLYGLNDSFYGLEHSRSNFAAFTARGGIGEFHEFRRAPGLNGHFLVNDPALWAFTMDEYVDRL